VIARLPIRLQITLAFTIATGVLLAVTGVFLQVRFRSDLDRTVNASLRSGADDVRTLADAAHYSPAERADVILTSRGDGFAALGSPRGSFSRRSAASPLGPVLDPAHLRRARHRPTFVTRTRVPGFEGTFRLLAIPVQSGPERAIAVVGTSLRERDRALHSLNTVLLLAGSAALLLASLAGYVAAGVSLRAIDAMRSRAEGLSVSEGGQRLPVPPGRDEVAQLGTTLNELLARVEATLARERAVLADASHELRTPLTVLKADIEVALRADSDRGELRRTLVSAGEETDRLVQLAEDLLVVARLAEGGLPVRPTPLAVDDLLARTASRFSQRAHEAGRRLRARPSRGLMVSGDASRVDQALSNLVDNALRHGRGRIELWAQVVGHAVELHVSDDGPGVPAAFAARAFDRFERGETPDVGGGTGLGLSIVQAIALAHGGEARLRPSASGGADFSLTLPRAVEHAHRPSTPGRHLPVASPSGATGPG
jgi:two-component system OmpR family sensor kinase